jgi:hypothetical protein
VSTMAIRAALEDMAQHDDSTRRKMARDALAELGAIEKAARDMVSDAGGDAPGSITDDEWKASIALMERIAKEAGQ